MFLRWTHLVLFSVFLWSSPAESTDDLTVKWGTDSWPGLTDGDGEALYDRIFSVVFSHNGMTIEKKIMPFSRALSATELGRIDFAGGIEKFEEESSEYYQAGFPIVEINTAVFYLAGTFPGDAPTSVEALANKTACASPEVAEQAGVAPEMIFHTSFKLTALELTLGGRCDYYIDGEGELKGTIAKLDAEDQSFAEAEGRMSIVAQISPHMVATRSDRGRKIIEAYEEGTVALFKNGVLEKIYQEAGMTVPSCVVEFVNELKQ